FVADVREEPQASADTRPGQTSAVEAIRDGSEHPARHGEARLAGELDAPPTVSQLEHNGRQPAAGGLAWGQFIGRAEDLAPLRTPIDAALGGQASLVRVAGEPGIGKTHLAEEAGAYARLRGAQVLVGRCYEGEAASPYKPFRRGDPRIRFDLSRLCAHGGDLHRADMAWAANAGRSRSLSGANRARKS